MADMPVIQTVEGFDKERIRMVLYGESGVGKTRFCSTWPTPLFLDADRGMASIRTKVDRIEIVSWDDLSNAYGMLAEGLPYKTVVLDTLNEIQLIGMKGVLENFPHVKRPYESLPGESDYGKMLYDFNNMIHAFRDLPYHVIFISQSNSKIFDTDTVMPQLTGKNTTRNLTRTVDLVGYMYKKEDEKRTRILSFDEAEFVTKDRSDKLPAFIENPTFDEMAKYWE